MTPAGRLQAVIDLLALIDATPHPADAVISTFFRERRFIGSKDRVAIAEHAYRLLRRHARLLWWIRFADKQPTPRARAIADLLVGEKRPIEAFLEAFNGSTYAPMKLTYDEMALARTLVTHTLEHPHMPDSVRYECPDWAAESLQATLGDRFGEEMTALLDSAPLDLRVNVLKADRETVKKTLAQNEIYARLTPHSPLGLRLKGRHPLASMDVFKDGLIEIQDEGSQLVALVVDAKPGQQVVDFCAGAGGKTLAVAASMNNKGRVVACDVLEKRLGRAQERFRRAGLHNIEAKPLTSERDPWVKRHKGNFDRVLVDAPCSGTGTWRRNPDARWRVLGPGLTELLPLQAEILDSAARLAKVGGRVIYATCSLLWDENEGQIEKFLEKHPDYKVVPLSTVWPEVAGDTPQPCPGPYLRLTPAQHDTDGFFAAILERTAPVAATPSAESTETAATENTADESTEQNA